jgi:integrase
MATYKFEINAKAGKDGLHLIMLRITHDRKLKRISTEVRVKPNHFNTNAKDGNWIRKTHTEYVKFNKALEKFKNEVDDIGKSLENKSAKAIKQAKKSGLTNDDLIGYYNKFVEDAKEFNSTTYAMAVKSRCKRFVEIYPELKFSDVNTQLLNEFKKTLKTKYKLSNNSIISHLNTLKAIFTNACTGENPVYKGYNPFGDFAIEKMKSRKEKLSYEQIKKIEALDLDKHSEIWHVRNYFLFAFYGAGIRISDLMQLRWNNIEDGYLKYTMNKNNKEVDILLTSEAIKILKVYKSIESNKDSLIFPILKLSNKNKDEFEIRRQINSKNGIINRWLKVIGVNAQIDKKISFHMSRHSFADHMRKQDISLYDIQKLMKHGTIQQTENYVKELDQSTSDKAMTSAFK